ncbi:MAG TPA: FAD-dependent oxidoreductase, partial [Acinetobacter sp.]|nr:FAD-dependent oxidoreductase [Acinetobacter sp.]
GVLALPGGNAKIAHQLVEHLKNKLGTSKLRSQSMVIRVIQKNDSCETTYLDQSGALKTIRSNHVILSCQKMIATRICPQMPEEQIRAIRRIQYRGYIVANIYFNQKNQPPAFDLFCMKGIYPEQPTAMKQAPFKITDIIFADWAQSTLTENDPDKSTTVLTAYCPLPFDGARQFLFNPIAFEKFKKAILQEILELAPSLNLDPQKIDSIRLQRWGHSLPVARTNFFSTNDYSMINQTINNRIHFANQDNYINPAFESAFAAADRIKLNNQA